VIVFPWYCRGTRSPIHPAPLLLLFFLAARGDTAAFAWACGGRYFVSQFGAWSVWPVLCPVVWGVLGGRYFENVMCGSALDVLRMRSPTQFGWEDGDAVHQHVVRLEVGMRLPARFRVKVEMHLTVSQDGSQEPDKCCHAIGAWHKSLFRSSERELLGYGRSFAFPALQTPPTAAGPPSAALARGLTSYGLLLWWGSRLRADW